MDELFDVKGEWYFEYPDGTVKGPFLNSFTTTGLAKIAEQIRGFSSPYLVVGDDSEAGYMITEIFRKPVSAITRDGALVRFRTQLLPGECNGDHKKISIYVEGTDIAGTGTMLNLLCQPWSKAANTTLTAECRIIVQGVIS